MKSFSSFGYPFLLRVTIPGLMGAALLFPLALFYNKKYDFLSIQPSVYFAISSILIGLTAVFLNEQIYRIFEGYLLWPNFIRRKLTKRLNVKIAKKYKDYRETEDETEKKMINDWLMSFPLRGNRADGESRNIAMLPTRLGNIIKEYEDYPMTRYGINSIFFWPLFWLSVDKDNRKEIESNWVVAECLLSISFLSLLIFLFYLSIIALDIMNIPSFLIANHNFHKLTDLDKDFPFLLFFIISMITLVISRLSYLFSLPNHRKNGSFYRAVFDLHKEDVKNKILIEESDFSFWHYSWSYLRYRLLFCKKCKKFFTPTDGELKCDRCREERSAQSNS